MGHKIRASISIWDTRTEQVLVYIGHKNRVIAYVTKKITSISIWDKEKKQYWYMGQRIEPVLVMGQRKEPVLACGTKRRTIWDKEKNQYGAKKRTSISIWDKEKKQY